MGILDLFFPKFCVNCKKLGSYLCPNCFSYLSFDTEEICLICGRGSIDGLTHPGCRSKFSIDGCFSAISYKGVAKKLVYKFKYNPFLTDLKKVLADLFYESIIQKEAFNKILSKKPVLVPIPLFKTKIKKRGYNQAEVLMNELAKKLDPSHSLRMTTMNLLERVRDTKSQVGLKQDERRENIKNAFAIPLNILVSQYPNILLVDDVLTTGSTLSEAAMVLKKNGADKVWGITLARD